jgi:hypothetical protein
MCFCVASFVYIASMRNDKHNGNVEGNDNASELLPKYYVDYAATRANPYAARRAEQHGFLRFGDQIYVPLDPDIIQTFHTASEVNSALRSLKKLRIQQFLKRLCTSPS